MVQKFRKKPVVIEAMHFSTDNDSGECINECVNWINSNGGRAGHDNTVITVATLEGEMTAQQGDWIIKGIKGEFYPCKNDVFDATYEPVTD